MPVRDGKGVKLHDPIYPQEVFFFINIVMFFMNFIYVCCFY